jgi:hypothetical protein
MEQAKVSCVDCGLLFSYPIHLQKHLKRGYCPNIEFLNDEPPTKKRKMNSLDDFADDRDKNVWDELLKKSYDQQHDRYFVKIEEYMEQGLDEKHASQKASEDLRNRYVKSLRDVYMD